ncbi:MAG TPA: DUF1800 domain-containing protein [Thermopetrobacter sp.]|nr:DUF1800 domain-containing protein [Thermopetrobacter sp.]
MRNVSTMMGLKDARHLATRAGIGAPLELVRHLAGSSRAEAVDFLLAQRPVPPAPPLLGEPAAVFMRRRQWRKSGQRNLAAQDYKRERNVLQAWGAAALLHDPAGLNERMTWFWHNHFVTSIKKVRIARFMFDHDAIVRRHALGNFGRLLHESGLSAAMLIYLDGQRNNRRQPNENFARELMELFTLGEGHYTERDIKEVARAFTGWRVRMRRGDVVFRRRLHDAGRKRVLGHEGNFGAADIFAILLKQPRTAELIAEKMWREFISLAPRDKTVIRSWAAVFRDSGYDIAALVRAVLMSDAFWDARHSGALIKSPVDLLIGTLRTLQPEDDVPPRLLARGLKRLGQELYAPPNVKGWPGGGAWIDDALLLRREAIINRLLRGMAAPRQQANRTMRDGTRRMTTPRITLPALPQAQWHDWLLATAPVIATRRRRKLADLRGLLRDPAYQVK